MRLNLHARIELAAATLLLLGSCSDSVLSDEQRDEIADIAASVTANGVAGTKLNDDQRDEVEEIVGIAIEDGIDDSSKIQDLESRLEAIESELEM